MVSWSNIDRKCDTPNKSCLSVWDMQISPNLTQLGGSEGDRSAVKARKAAPVKIETLKTWTSLSNLSGPGLDRIPCGSGPRLQSDSVIQPVSYWTESESSDWLYFHIFKFSSVVQYKYWLFPKFNAFFSYTAPVSVWSGLETGWKSWPGFVRRSNKPPPTSKPLN